MMVNVSLVDVVDEQEIDAAAEFNKKKCCDVYSVTRCFVGSFSLVAVDCPRLI